MTLQKKTIQMKFKNLKLPYKILNQCLKIISKENEFLIINDNFDEIIGI